MIFFPGDLSIVLVDSNSLLVSKTAGGCGKPSLPGELDEDRAT